MNHLPVLIVAVPLCAALLCPLLCKIKVELGKDVVILSLFSSLCMAVMQLVQIAKTGETVHYHIGGWAPPLGIEFVIDGINAFVLILVACVAFFTALFSHSYEKFGQDEYFKTAGYYTIVCLLGVGLLGMSSTGDAFNLYVFMEIVALAGYGLIAIGEKKGPTAAFRYLLSGTIGACSYLMGLGLLFAITGTLNMEDLAARIATTEHMDIVIISMACMLVGFGIKMALFPLHGWQPAAHSYAHPAADPMIAGIMIKVPAYAMLRYFFFVFGDTVPVMNVMLKVLGVLGVCGILFGSLKALRYNKYNKILAYSSIGQVGYVALGFAIGNVYGLIGAILHIVNHGFMKAGLFYTSGALKYRYGIHDTDRLGQVYRQMPLTGGSMVVLMLSMMGLPPFAGFFSKWYLAVGAIQNGQYFYVAILIISSLLSVIYFFRVLEHLFMDTPVTLHDRYAGHKLELPISMVAPIVLAALIIIGLGLGNSVIVNGVLKTVVKGVALW